MRGIVIDLVDFATEFDLNRRFRKVGIHSRLFVVLVWVDWGVGWGVGCVCGVSYGLNYLLTRCRLFVAYFGRRSHED